MKASMALQVLPSTQDQEEMIKVIDHVIEHIQNSGLNYHVGPFETTVEGDDYIQILDLLKECHKICFDMGVDSLSSYVKLHFSNESILSIEDKIGKYSK